jgi:small-conductance mechanosensitive channel/CRP-like cAMP-binding protein
METLLTHPLVLLLIATFLIFFPVIAVSRVRGKWPLWLRAVWAIANFTLLSFIMRQLFITPLRPHYFEAAPAAAFWERLVVAGWWLAAARGGIALMRLVVVLEHRPRETQIISDLAAGGIYIATGLAIVDFVFAVPIGGLLATSGIIAIVLGLALQNTLADVFSGIAVGVERPYRAGDLIWVEGEIEGQVVQVTWRSTHIATGQNNIAIVPNSVMAKARIINRSRPSLVRGGSVSVRLDPTIPPQHCEAALIAAARSCPLLLDHPAPEVACIALSGDGCSYQLEFSVASSSLLTKAQNQLLTAMHRHLRAAGIALAVAGQTTIPAPPAPTPAEILEKSDLFGMIEPEQRDLLASHFETLNLQTGDVLIRQDAEPDALYVIASGAVEVAVAEAAGPPRVVHHIQPGESVGAIGLITGARYAATATARTPVKAYRLDKDAIADAIRMQPKLAKGLEVLAQRGQRALRRDSTAGEEDRQGHSDVLLSRLRNLIQVLQSR